MSRGDPRPWRPHLSARVRLTLSYTLFLVLATIAAMLVIYVVTRYLPSYPLTDARNPENYGGVASRGEILQALLTSAGYALIIVTLIGIGAGWYLAGRVLRPLQLINAAAREAAEGSLEHRVGLSAGTRYRDEFTDLSDTFDTMLERLQATFETQRRFAANTSHELRTPLAVSRTMLEVAAADPAGTNYPVLIDRLQLTNQRATNTVNAMLRLSQIGTARREDSAIDLTAILTVVLAESAAEARERGLTLTEQLAPAPLRGDADLVHQLTGNLILNAIRHNSDTGGWIAVTSGSSSAGAWVRVANSGAVRDPATVAALFEPFVRGTGRTARRDTGATGYGLGLALAQQIMRAHHGSLTAHARTEGGLEVIALFPTASPRRRDHVI